MLFKRYNSHSKCLYMQAFSNQIRFLPRVLLYFGGGEAKPEPHAFRLTIIWVWVFEVRIYVKRVTQNVVSI